MIICGLATQNSTSNNFKIRQMDYNAQIVYTIVMLDSGQGNTLSI